MSSFSRINRVLLRHYATKSKQQYLVLAIDKNPSNPAQRLTHRPAHLLYAAQLKQKGQIIFGGAILDQEQKNTNGDAKMVGSCVLYQVDHKEQLDNIMSRDPYVVGEVWGDIQVYPFKLALPQKQDLKKEAENNGI